MTILTDLTITEIQQIRWMIRSHSDSKNIAYIGDQAEIFEQEFIKAGFRVYGYQIDPSKRNSSYPEDCDAFIVHSKTILDLDEQFIASFAGKRAEFWVIYPLLEITPEFLDITKSLMKFNFLRDPGVELWVSDRILLCKYLHSDNLKNELHKHELEWWRLVQANRKYQNLVNEYFNENVIILATSKEYERKIRELEQGILEIQESNRVLQESNRLLQESNLSLSEQWDAFWNSRTGKTLTFIKRIARR